MTKIKAIIWDIGGVLSPSPHAAVAAYAAEVGTTDAIFRLALFGPRDHDTDHPWHRLERGELELNEALALISTEFEAQGIEADPFGWLAHARDQEYDTAPLIERITELHAAGVRHAVLTNNLAAFKDGWRKLVPIELFELVVDSHEVGLRKPEAAIYEFTLERLGLEAHETIFLDDTPENVTGARDLGIVGIDVGPNPLETLAALNDALA